MNTLLSYRGLKHFIIFTLLWLLLTKAQMSSWIIGILVVPVATWLSLTLYVSSSTNAIVKPRITLQWRRLPQFMVFFFSESLRGGWQTALLALSKNRQPSPGLMTYQIGLPKGIARLCFMHLISLLPGTISVRRKHGVLTLHVLDKQEFDLNDIVVCEQKIAQLFGLTLPGEVSQ